MSDLFSLRLEKQIELLTSQLAIAHKTNIELDRENDLLKEQIEHVYLVNKDFAKKNEELEKENEELQIKYDKKLSFYIHTTLNEHNS